MTSLNSQLFHLPELKVSIIFVERERGIFALFYANLSVCKCQDALLKGAKTLSRVQVTTGVSSLLRSLLRCSYIHGFCLKIKQL